jgi:hypothetical protein
MPTSNLPMNPVPIRYALDLTGQDINNLVTDEVHVLSTKEVRSIAPTYGPYYSNSLIVTDSATNRILKRGVDYTCLDVVGLRTAQSGQEVCSILAITNKLVGGSVRLSYQTVGGYYLGDYEPIRLLIDNLANDTRQVQWENIINRPEAFDPQKHLHRLGDVIGFEYVVVALESIRNAILLGDDVAHTSIIAQLDLSIQGMTRLLNNANATHTAVATAAAADANTASALALKIVKDTQTQTGAMEDRVNLALVKSIQLLSSIAQSETQAKSILDNYPAIFFAQSNSNLIDKPPSARSSALYFPLAESKGLVCSDRYAITDTGKVVVGDDSEYSATAIGNLVFLIKLSAYKDAGTGQAHLDLQINTLDQRDATLKGKYADTCQVTLFAPALDDGSHNLTGVNVNEASYVCAEAPVDQLIRGVSYGIIGVDASANLDLKRSAVDNVLTANRIASYLFDFRSDFNVSGYGVSTGRAGVKLNLPIGCELAFTFKFSGISLGDLRKYVILSFKQSLKVMSATGAATNPTTIKDVPDNNCVRSLSVYY